MDVEFLLEATEMQVPHLHGWAVASQLRSGLVRRRSEIDHASLRSQDGPP